MSQEFGWHEDSIGINSFAIGLKICTIAAEIKNANH